MGLADRLFENSENKAAVAAAEEELTALLREAGAPFSDIGWDWYDCSLELYKVAPTWRMPPELQKRLWDEGFIKAYVNHSDLWETHYSFGTTNGFEAKKGWRVSYPHKRNDDGGQIWVEEDVPSWPRSWFQRLFGLRSYVIVKPSN